ncbi:SAM-dependent methyltransferase [Carboxydothermus hydrogenoformans]|uniref:Putative precorrin-2 C20-methyltransferase n=1 Tax=Carboxydothermus hydrogenoformans (strain ATCC BAA-161 / DSM 6008 / Z-2901) TaxID=246194 RepID=Q3AE19_CARHZ|nr:precorrin-2 C(20)-methyltransferase [Carboxydothermus hydrogenoformans]ABB13775.1 putative precorrin-2 C20-methyltransferase [Carboxydothermus hydrogenoformans Z-2901]
MAKLYVVGVGPGDPELITVKAMKILRGVRVLVFPGKRAFKVVESFLSDDKEILFFNFPMVEDEGQKREAAHTFAQKILEYLNREEVSFFTLGDPGLYSTAGYLLEALKQLGFAGDIEIVPGINSFSLAAAKSFFNLAFEDEKVEILSTLPEDFTFEPKTTYVFLKLSSYYDRFLELVKEAKIQGYYFKELGTEEEKICSFNELPEKTGYFSLALAKRGT